MSSGFPGGMPDFFAAGMNNNQFTFSGIQPDQEPQIGKRSLAEFGYCSRNVKPRPSFQHAPPISTGSPLDFTTLLPHLSSSISMNHHHIRDFPILSPQQSLIPSNSTTHNQYQINSESRKLLQELEKQLLGDEDDGEAASAVTNSDWSETIQNLMHKHLSPSPTSSSSSCSSTSASPPLLCSKQSLIDAAVAISEGKTETLAEIFTRLQPLANAKANSEQRLAAYMVSALKSRLNPADNPPPISELHGKEQAISTQMLYEASPCFKLGFMAANLAILEATSELGLNKIHVLDLDIGQGGQYVHLLHALAAKKSSFTLKITTLADFDEKEELQSVGEWLKEVANKLGVGFAVCIMKGSDWNRQSLEVESDEALAVNFAFQLYKLPDESVTTENLRDDLLRRMKGLSPTVMTVVEQEMNANTAPLAARVREVCEHYGALFDSLDSTVPKDNSDRVRIDQGLRLRIKNSIACEGRDRVERCEVFGKWRARVGMSGFNIRPMSQRILDSLRAKLNSCSRGNPGFTITQESGGICFGWRGRTLTVSSAWC